MMKMDEEKEKQLARQLGDYLDGAISADALDDELLPDVEAAFALLSVSGGVPELKPEFDEALRARLVRDVRRRAAGGGAKTKKTMPFWKPRWMQAAMAAAVFILLVPTVFLVRERQYQHKLELVAKYDKMYTPFTVRMKQNPENDYWQPFSETYSNKVRAMTRKAAFVRTEYYTRTKR
jgi:hypothetical protein